MQRDTNLRKLIIAVGVTAFLAACAKEEPTPVVEPEPEPQPPVVEQPVDTGPTVEMKEYLATVIGDRVHFDYDSSELDAEDRAMLQAQARWLNGNNYTVTIEGHADERGTRDYNLALGDRRANAVKNYLVALGVNANRINTISYGKERPVAGNTCSAERCWSLNRRGVMVVN